MARAVDAVTRYTAVMMVRDWLTGGRLTLLVSPARYVPYTSRPAYSTEQMYGGIIFITLKHHRVIIIKIINYKMM